MENDAFTAGVKPGGLNSSTEIRVLLCYLMQNAPAPLSQDEIKQALLSEELVNYFEMASALSALCKQQLVDEVDGRYVLLERGHDVARSLTDSLPRSVRESALKATLFAQQFARKEAQHQARIETLDNGYSVHCAIADMGSDIFSCSLYLPDWQSASFVKNQFVEHGDEFYKIMLAALTGNHELIAELLTQELA